MGALVGSEVTEVTALEFWSFASSDVVLLGRKGQAESEGGGPACCSLLPASAVRKSEQRWAEYEELPPRQRCSCHPRPRGRQASFLAVLPALGTTLFCWSPLRPSQGLRHQRLLVGVAVGADAMPVCPPAPCQGRAPRQAPVHIGSHPDPTPEVLFSGRTPLGRVATGCGWLAPPLTFISPNF